jgi:hypothetical protein
MWLETNLQLFLGKWLSMAFTGSEDLPFPLFFRTEESVDD